MKSESIKVFPVPIYANKISLDHDKFALREIKSKLDQNKSDNFLAQKLIFFLIRIELYFMYLFSLIVIEKVENQYSIFFKNQTN